MGRAKGSVARKRGSEAIVAGITRSVIESRLNKLPPIDLPHNFFEESILKNELNALPKQYRNRVTRGFVTVSSFVQIASLLISLSLSLSLV